MSNYERMTNCCQRKEIISCDLCVSGEEPILDKRAEGFPKFYELIFVFQLLYLFI